MLVNKEGAAKLTDVLAEDSSGTVHDLRAAAGCGSSRLTATGWSRLDLAIIDEVAGVTGDDFPAARPHRHERGAS